jgi:hypothetical protein
LPAIHDRDILEAALVGYEQQQKLIDAKIDEIKAMLGSPIRRQFHLKLELRGVLKNQA